MVEIPTGDAAPKSVYGFKPQANGTVALIIETPQAGQVQLSIPLEDLARFTAAALHSARVASGLSGKTMQKIQTVDAHLAGALPDQIGLALGPATDQVSLVAHFGAATFAIPFQKGEATRIGHALLAAGTSSKGAQ